MNLWGRSCVQLPKNLQNKGATINPQYQENQCFKQAITIALNVVDDNSKARDHLQLKPKVPRKQVEELDWEGINFPETFKDINKFEEQTKIYQ